MAMMWGDDDLSIGPGGVTPTALQSGNYGQGQGWLERMNSQYGQDADMLMYGQLGKDNVLNTLKSIGQQAGLPADFDWTPYVAQAAAQHHAQFGNTFSGTDTSLAGPVYAIVQSAAQQYPGLQQILPQIGPGSQFWQQAEAQRESNAQHSKKSGQRDVMGLASVFSAPFLAAAFAPAGAAGAAHGVPASAAAGMGAQVGGTGLGGLGASAASVMGGAPGMGGYSAADIASGAMTGGAEEAGLAAYTNIGGAGAFGFTPPSLSTVAGGATTAAGAAGGGGGGGMTPGVGDYSETGFGGWENDIPGGPGVGGSGGYQFPLGNVVGSILGLIGSNQNQQALGGLLQQQIDSDQWRTQQSRYFEPLHQAATTGTLPEAYSKGILDASARKSASMGYNMTPNQQIEMSENLNRGAMDYVKTITPLATGRGESTAPSAMAPSIMGANNQMYGNLANVFGSVYNGQQPKDPRQQQNQNLGQLFGLA